MRTSNRFVTVVGGTAIAALLAACGTNPTQPVASSPSGSIYQPIGTAPSTSYPSATMGTAPAATAPAAIELGRVTDIQTVQMGAAPASGSNPSVTRAVAGGIIGAVVGNVVGKNVNSGDNRTAATVLGAAGGAAIGNRSGQQAENSTASSGAGGPAYRVTVQTDQGQWRTYEVAAVGDLRVGDRVRVENNVIYRS